MAHLKQMALVGRTMSYIFLHVFFVRVTFSHGLKDLIAVYQAVSTFRKLR